VPFAQVGVIKMSSFPKPPSSSIVVAPGLCLRFRHCDLHCMPKLYIVHARSGNQGMVIAASCLSCTELQVGLKLKTHIDIPSLYRAASRLPLIFPMVNAYGYGCAQLFECASFCFRSLSVNLMAFAIETALDIYIRCLYLKQLRQKQTGKDKCL